MRLGTYRVLAMALAAWIGGPVGAVYADLYFPDFSSTAGWNLVGSAAQSGEVLRLTPAPAQLHQRGGAWYTTKQDVASGFVATFQFQIPYKVGLGADGFAFVIQNSGVSALGDEGGNIAYGGDLLPGIANSLAVEFDTFLNREWQDPSQSHIAVQSGGVLANSASHIPASGFSRGLANVPDFSDGGIHTARIAYGGQSMSVFLDDLATPVLTSTVDLESLLGLDNGRAFVGFTSATGGGHPETHDILNADFVTVPAPGALVLAAVGLGMLTWVRRRVG